MRSLVPTVADSIILTDVDAHRLWNWVLRRQGLADDTRLSTAYEIAREALGLHAARLPSPFATVLARSASADVAVSLFSPLATSTLITVRCMRKTLHTLPLSLAAIAHAATRHFRVRDALRLIENARFSLYAAERTISRIEDLLAESGALYHREIERRIARKGTDVRLVRLSLKLAWERGQIAYLNRSRGWNRENRQFALTTVAFPDLDMELDREAAEIALMSAYFDRYGPASLSDAAWWSGSPRSAAVRCLQGDRPVVELWTSWGEAPLYMFADRYSQFVEDATEPRTGVNLLAHEDVALKAYFETRTRYLGALSSRLAFNEIGEALPTVVYDGRVIGIWHWFPREMCAKATLFSNDIPTNVRRAVRTQVDRLTTSLRMGWTSGSDMPVC